MNVSFTGDDAKAAVDPILTAARQDREMFRESFMTFTEKDIKAMLKNHALATNEQVKAAEKIKPKKDGLVDLLWDGARRKIAERQSH